jgi:hypothetical protein
MAHLHDADSTGAETCLGCGCRIGGWISSKREMYQDED